jgi:secondary thiamine-phosphate synthase enzyme
LAANSVYKMKTVHTSLTIQTQAKVLNEITHDLIAILEASECEEGLVNVFCKHTSCSLVIMENADPSARRDLENYMERLVPEKDAHFTHTYEGPDDMPSHIKMALTRTSETIPFKDGRLLLGTWQGVFLWEHRSQPHNRDVIVSVCGE